MTERCKDRFNFKIEIYFEVLRYYMSGQSGSEQIEVASWSREPPRTNAGTGRVDRNWTKSGGKAP